MKLWIPTIGDAFSLTEDWSFSLVHEHRNSDFADALGIIWSDSNFRKWDEPSEERPVTLVANTELVVDRIYIRQGAEDFDSLTFVIKSSPNIDMIGWRFWASLEDVNKISCVATTTGNPVGTFAGKAYRAAAANPEQLIKAAARKAAVEELAWVREQLVKRIDLILNHPEHSFREHLERIITIGHQDLNAKYNHAYHRTAVKYRIANEENWKCVSTKRKDDMTVRKFCFDMNLGSKSINGFILTTQGRNVVSMTPYT